MRLRFPLHWMADPALLNDTSEMDQGIIQITHPQLEEVHHIREYLHDGATLIIAFQAARNFIRAEASVCPRVNLDDQNPCILWVELGIELMSSNVVSTRWLHDSGTKSFLPLHELFNSWFNFC